MVKKLTPNEVLFQIDLNQGNEDVKLKDIPQINSAYKKIKRAINIEEDNFNVFIIDSFSKYKVNELIKYIEEIYKDKKGPKDICYVTYEDYRKPEPLILMNGNGKRLKESVEKLKNKYFDVVIEFYNTSSDEEKDRIIEEINTKRSSYIGELIQMAKEEGFDLKATSGGFAFIPLSEGEALTEKEYDELPEDNKDSIIVKAGYLKRRAEVVLEKIKDIEVISLEKLKEIYLQYITINMEEEKENILLDFIMDDEAYDYLEKLFTLIEKKIVECYSINIEEDQSEVNKVLNNFEISVLVDNSEYKHPRVIYEEDPSIMNLIGNVEYESHNGSYSTDLSLITPGSLVLANEGCIIIRLNQLVTNNMSYYALKKVLLTNKASLDSYKNYLDLLSISGLKTEPIPIKTKVILIGDYESYDTLYNIDEDFKMLFPVRVEMKNHLERENVSGNSIKNFIKSRFYHYNLTEISEDAIKEVARYLCRITDDRNIINIQVEVLDNLIILLREEIKERPIKYIDKTDIINIAYEKEKIEDELLKMYKEDKIVLSLDGKKCGTINGLAVIDSGYHRFGKPIRLTCISCKGMGKIIDIQKESNLSGNIHEKSISILEGILADLFEPYGRLPINFHVSFEQIYGMLDGDSASVAEMLVILSALAKAPIKQNIAVTGSLNLFKEVQPIGGLKEKIEGFYKICKSLNRAKDIGVLIPSRNLSELILLPEIEEAVEKGEFSIYTMDTLEDAIKIMIDEDLEGFYNKIRLEIEKYKLK